MPDLTESLIRAKVTYNRAMAAYDSDVAAYGLGHPATFATKARYDRACAALDALEAGRDQ
jgi:hypothetical protein